MFSCSKDKSYISSPDFIQNYFNDSLAVVTSKKEVPGIGIVDWKCNGLAVQIKNSSRIGIYLQTYSLKYLEKYNFFALREELSFGYFNLMKADYSSKLSDIFVASNDSTLIGVSFHRFEDDGDVGSGSWKLDIQQKNTFEITKINSADSTFTGTFDFHFVESNGGNSVAPYSKNINFLDGKFTLPIPK